MEYSGLGNKEILSQTSLNTLIYHHNGFSLQHTHVQLLTKSLSTVVNITNKSKDKEVNQQVILEKFLIWLYISFLFFSFKIANNDQLYLKSYVLDQTFHYKSKRVDKNLCSALDAVIVAPARTAYKLLSFLYQIKVLRCTEQLNWKIMADYF